MENVQHLLQDIIPAQSLIQATFSNPRSKAQELPAKVQIKQVRLKEGLQYQLTSFIGTKVIHENISEAAITDRMLQLLQTSFKQGLLQDVDADYQLLANKIDHVSILRKPPSKKPLSTDHNRKKSYLLAEGHPVPFLVELGVMTKEGKVIAAKYDKFKQINRFLEMVNDVTDHLPKHGRLHIVDFGCGKSYLTFALYHHLVYQQGRDVDIRGMDLKRDVIEQCELLARKMNYAGLHFHCGDISSYVETHKIDMVVTLHACDTATDAALDKAVRWGADVILSVPCCQHELFNQINNELLSPMLDHGIIKERLAALTTDSVRAHLLQLVGYKTQLLEFIDLEHTPKNLLIRAYKQELPLEQRRKLASEFVAFKQFLHIDPYLERSMHDLLQPLFLEK